MKKLTEEQEVMLSFLPDGFEGNNLMKLTMAAFCYCNYCALERGEKYFTLGYDALAKMTGYNSRDKLSKAVKKICSDGYTTCIRKGDHITHRNSTYATFYIERGHNESQKGDIKGDTIVYPNDAEKGDTIVYPFGDIESQKGDIKGDITPQKGDTNYNYNINYNNKFNKAYAYLSLRIQELSCAYEKQIQELKDINAELIKRIEKLEGNTNKQVSEDKKIEVRKPTAFDDINRKYSELMAKANNTNISVSEREQALIEMKKMDSNGELTKRQSNALIYIERDINKPKPQKAVREPENKPKRFLNDAERDYDEWGDTYDDFKEAYDNNNTGVLTELAFKVVETVSRMNKHIKNNEVPSKASWYFNQRVYPNKDKDRYYKQAEDIVNNTNAKAC